MSYFFAEKESGHHPTPGTLTIFTVEKEGEELRGKELERRQICKKRSLLSLVRRKDRFVET